MLKKIRVVLAIISLVALTLLFLDFTGTASALWGWLAKLQFMPAVLACNFVALIILLVLTLVFGRIYCSVICPLGIMQDVVNFIRGHVGKKSKRKNRFAFKPELTIVRALVLTLFCICVICGFLTIAALIEPYSEYGRIVSAFLAPVYDSANNLLADMAASRDSYTFYHVDLPAVFIPALILSGITLVVVALFAWFTGRGYCNTICPVGTILGYLSKFSLLKPVIDTNLCNGCRKCERNCKASCINAKTHSIDYSRCVDCMDCVENCSTGAIRYTWHRTFAPLTPSATDKSRRKFMASGAVIVGALAAKAEDKLTDGGFAEITPKTKPSRSGRIVPPGAVSLDNLTSRCTMCQLCISECPNGVLRPSMDAATFMQPEVSYENGYCRPECTRCSSVCPAGAIHPIDRAEKSAIHIGAAAVNLDLCLSVTAQASCGKCSRKCPAGAIEMVAMEPAIEGSPLMPVVNDAACIGCGACENLCPVSPVSAIVVNGYEVHRHG